MVDDALCVPLVRLVLSGMLGDLDDAVQHSSLPALVVIHADDLRLEF